MFRGIRPGERVRITVARRYGDDYSDEVECWKGVVEKDMDLTLDLPKGWWRGKEE